MFIKKIDDNFLSMNSRILKEQILNWNHTLEAYIRLIDIYIILIRKCCKKQQQI